MDVSLPKRINITDQSIGLTFSGDVKSFQTHQENITVLLKDVAVYEYSSSNYLYQLTEITLSGLATNFHVEEIE